MPALRIEAGDGDVSSVGERHPRGEQEPLMTDLTYEVWKVELASALDIQCGWQPGEGLIHIAHCADGNWR